MRGTRTTGVARAFRIGDGDGGGSGQGSVVLRYYCYMATSTLGFLIPVWVVLLDEARGFSYTQIQLLDGAFFATLLLAELPTGYVGDRLGRRNALVLSSVGVGLAAAVFGLVESFPAFFAVYVLWGVAQTFRTGNDSAWLYDTLAGYGEVGTFTRVRGRGLAVLLGTNAATAVAGGYLYGLDPRYPFLATGLVNLAGVPVLLSLPESPVADGDRFTLGDARRALSGLLAPGLRWFVAYAALFYSLGWAADVFIQPIGLAAGLDAVDLGYLYALLIGASAVASTYADAVARRVGVGRLLRLSPLLLGAALLALPLLPVAAVGVFLLQRVVLNATAPVAETYLNDRVASLGRATVVSGFSMALSAVSIPVKLASGPLADATSPTLTVAAFGGALLVGCALLVVVVRPMADADSPTPAD
ncbi:MFS transporter [Halobium salinum]|uniref:MFS transporter n=1 Tax=Halobium salinum TaxID=1364940 RepID=A0ABD5P7K7_9EURY|nr:MFS transporter [Halobium salinum]